jgi:hypothetical protein
LDSGEVYGGGSRREKRNHIPSVIKTPKQRPDRELDVQQSRYATVVSQSGALYFFLCRPKPHRSTRATAAQPTFHGESQL